MKHSDLYSRPELYELLAPPDPTIERFYVDMALERPGPVLDLACGTGRFTIPIAEAGRQVVGGDLSEEMLVHARSSAIKRGVDIDFVQLDMRDFDLQNRKFDTIIIAINSILHLGGHEDFDGFFTSVSRHLSEDGRLVFDAFVPNLSILNRDQNRRHHIADVASHYGSIIQVEEAMKYDPMKQISQIDWFWSMHDSRDFWISSFSMRQIFPQELLLLLKLGGMQLVGHFGDFDRTPFSSTSYRQVCVCVRT